MRLQGIEVARDGADVPIDRPFVVIQDDDEFLGGLGDVVEGLEGGSAGEGSVSGDGDDVVVTTFEIACSSHAEGSGEGGASVAGAVGIVFGFGAQEEAIQSLVGAYGIDGVRTAGEHFVDVALMGDVEDKLVGRGLEHPVHGDGKFDDAKVWPEVAAGLRKAADELGAYFRSEADELRFGKVLQIVRGRDGIQEGLEVRLNGRCCAGRFGKFRRG